MHNINKQSILDVQAKVNEIRPSVEQVIRSAPSQDAALDGAGLRSPIPPTGAACGGERLARELAGCPDCSGETRQCHQRHSQCHCQLLLAGLDVGEKGLGGIAEGVFLALTRPVGQVTVDGSRLPPRVSREWRALPGQARRWRPGCARRSDGTPGGSARFAGGCQMLQ